MTSKKVVDTIRGSSAQYGIFRKGPATLTSSDEFWIRKNGESVAGPFSSKKAAIKWARKKS
jgi:hypothetical protein